MLAGNIDIKSMCVNITNMVYENDEQMANDIISSLCSEEIMSSFSELMTNSGYNEMVERVCKMCLYLIISFTRCFLY